MLAHKKKPGCVGIVSFGPVPHIAAQMIARQIHESLNLSTEILPPMAPPTYAYDAKRMQYNAAAILHRFESIPFGDHTKLIGILNVDLFIPIFTHVFGEAQQGGRCALVSLYRLRPNSDGSMAPKPLYLERFGKVALHELGHLFNLLHCENKRCLMHFSGCVKELDGQSFYLCEYCSIYLQDKIQR